jgi:hypothetical protein
MEYFRSEVPLTVLPPACTHEGCSPMAIRDLHEATLPEESDSMWPHVDLLSLTQLLCKLSHIVHSSCGQDFSKDLVIRK